MTNKRWDRKKMRIFEFRNRIRIFGTNSKIQENCYTDQSDSRDRETHNCNKII